MLPEINPETNHVITLGVYKPRQSDWSEVDEVLDIIGRRDYGNFLYEYFPNLQPHTEESLTLEKLSEWYSGRAEEIERRTGQGSNDRTNPSFRTKPGGP